MARLAASLLRRSVIEHRHLPWPDPVDPLLPCIRASLALALVALEATDRRVRPPVRGPLRVHDIDRHPAKVRGVEGATAVAAAVREMYRQLVGDLPEIPAVAIAEIPRRHAEPLRVPMASTRSLQPQDGGGRLHPPTAPTCSARGASPAPGYSFTRSGCPRRGRC